MNLRDGATRLLRLLQPSTATRGTRPRNGKGKVRTARSAYLGDWTAPLPAAVWEPQADGEPDPGEVVWAWVPYEEDHMQGKDRPVVLIARDPEVDDAFLALPLTSKDHDRDAAQEARAGRRWMDVGSGPWDRSGRPTEVRLNRVLRLRAGEIRREGAAMPRATFDAVLSAAQGH